MRIKFSNLCFLLAGLLVSSGSLAESEGLSSKPEFRFHLSSEPSSLKSWEQKNSGNSYFLSLLTAPLLSYKNGELTGNSAETCKYLNSKLIECRLKKDLQWSDGSSITATNFIKSFQEFLDPSHHAFRADLLFSLKNAKAVFQRSSLKTALGVSAVGSLKIRFNLEIPDREFIYILANPLFGPLPSADIPAVDQARQNPKGIISSGPYQIVEWVSQTHIKLQNNPYFWKKINRPDLEIIYVTEDSVALGLFEKKQLSFLRRLPTLYIPKYQGKPEFFEIEQFRFDYLGFAPRISAPLRKAVAFALNYQDLQELYHAKPRPGCPGIGASLHNDTICVSQDIPEAKRNFSLLKPPPEKFELLYSKQGGDDHKRSMEWIQSELKKNLRSNIGQRFSGTVQKRNRTRSTDLPCCP